MESQENPYQAASTASIPQQTIETRSARERLLPVAISLLVVSLLHIFAVLFYAAFIYRTIVTESDPERQQSLITYSLYFGITALFAILLIAGSFGMMRQGSYLWAMTTCILALIPFIGPCYFLGIPIGIWGLIVLRRPSVRDSFARM
jgi:hypothetical protein